MLLNSNSLFPSTLLRPKKVFKFYPVEEYLRISPSHLLSGSNSCFPSISPFQMLSFELRPMQCHISLRLQMKVTFDHVDEYLNPSPDSAVESFKSIHCNYPVRCCFKQTRLDLRNFLPDLRDVSDTRCWDFGAKAIPGQCIGNSLEKAALLEFKWWHRLSTCCTCKV